MKCVIQFEIFCIFFLFVGRSIATRSVLNIENHVFGNRLTKCFYIRYFLLRSTKVIAMKTKMQISQRISISSVLYTVTLPFIIIFNILHTLHKIIYIYDYVPIHFHDFFHLSVSIHRCCYCRRRRRR